MRQDYTGLVLPNMSMMESPVVRLWTIQHAGAWDRARRRGVLRADGRFVYHHHRRAYRWMRGQMARRVSGYRNHYPIWAWYRPKPDLRRAGHLPRGESGVRLEFLAPMESVLLSDFMNWHGVLNDGPITLDEAEYDAFQRACALTCRPGRHTPACRKATEATWERVFELERPDRADPVWWGEGDLIQAVLPEVPLSWVTAVTRFVAR